LVSGTAGAAGAAGAAAGAASWKADVLEKGLEIRVPKRIAADHEGRKDARMVLSPEADF
jgi:hypothetical protein